MTRTDKNKQPPAATQPSISASQAIPLLQRQKEKGELLLSNRPISSGNLDAWENTTRELLIKAFGAGSGNISAVIDIGKYGGFPMKAGEDWWEERRARDLQEKITMLGSVIEQLEIEKQLLDTNIAAKQTAKPQQTVTAGQKTVSILCNNCQKITRHAAYSPVKAQGSEIYEGHDYILWTETYRILQCRGCEHVTYHTQTWNEADDDPYGNPIYRDTYYPPPATHPQPKWVDELEYELQTVLEELYTAFHHSLKYLTAIGVRTALDIVIVDKIGDIGGFQKKIERLETDGHITKGERELVETLTEVGNAAAHRGYAPEMADLDNILTILENLLHKFYIQENTAQELLKHAQRLKSGVPKRNQKR